MAAAAPAARTQTRNSVPGIRAPARWSGPLLPMANGRTVTPISSRLSIRMSQCVKRPRGVNGTGETADGDAPRRRPLEAQGGDEVTVDQGAGGQSSRQRIDQRIGDQQQPDRLRSVAIRNRASLDFVHVPGVRVRSDSSPRGFMATVIPVNAVRACTAGASAAMQSGSTPDTAIEAPFTSGVTGPSRSPSPFEYRQP